jgi:hypothetical protein
MTTTAILCVHAGTFKDIPAVVRVVCTLACPVPLLSAFETLSLL